MKPEMTYHSLIITKELLTHSWILLRLGGQVKGENCKDLYDSAIEVQAQKLFEELFVIF